MEYKDEGVDYKELYLHMARAADDAIRLLQKAMQECEERCITAEQDQA